VSILNNGINLQTSWKPRFPRPCVTRVRGAPSEKSRFFFFSKFSRFRQPLSKQDARQNRVKFVPSKVSAPIDYDLDRDLRAWTRCHRGETSRARAHVKSIFCHTLTRCCPNLCGIYDETLNDRSLSHSGLYQRADFFGPDRRVDRFVWLLAPKRNRRVPDLPSCDSAHSSDFRSCDSACISIFCRANATFPSRRKSVRETQYKTRYKT